MKITELEEQINELIAEICLDGRLLYFNSYNKISNLSSLCERSAEKSLKWKTSAEIVSYPTGA